MRLKNIDLRSLLLGLFVGAGGLLLLGLGPGENFPRFQITRPWVSGENHGAYVIDTSNGSVVAVEGSKSKRVEGP
jgi:hypothetical protein